MSLRIYGNRLLKTLPGDATRPTPARVREALFHIWQDTVVGCHWLDLCTGSGAMGAEALCRGATLVVGIEQSPRACAVIQANWRQVAQPEQTFRLLRGDVRQRLKGLAGETFDHIYFDPPYASELYAPVLRAIAQYLLLTPQGELAVEHNPRHSPPLPDRLHLCRQKVYGNTALSFYTLT